MANVRDDGGWCMEIKRANSSLIKDVILHYEGAMSEDSLPKGYGSATFVNRSQYEGEWRNGLMHGRGTLTFSHGITYFGQFIRNCISGQGLYTWPNGTYEGAVKDGLPHGLGRMTSKMNGIEYVGNWREGKRHGKGKLIIECGEKRTIFEGDWVDDNQHGNGSITYPSGNKYHGQWIKGKKAGSGKMHWYDRNETYDGEWKEDKPNGRGEYVWLIKDLYKADRKGSKFISRHNKYLGMFHNGQREGYGKLLYGNGSIYEGEFHLDEKHGDGLYLSESGELLLCKFENERLVESNLVNTLSTNTSPSISLLDILDTSNDSHHNTFSSLKYKRDDLCYNRMMSI